MVEFRSFPEIKKIGALNMSITQKIHGTNAHVLVFKNESGELDLVVGSRTRFITPFKDNYGFASHVSDNKQAFIELLGEGRHDGEWAGPGINSGEGLTEKKFILFEPRKYRDRPLLPPQTTVVPTLYEGKADFEQIQKAMDDLKTNGSKLVPGFMRPEGIVVRVGHDRYKVVFDPEETKWKSAPEGGNSNKTPKPKFDFSHLLQPIRLEKLLSRDEIYLKEYPYTMTQIMSLYVMDLIKEEQIVGTEDEIKDIKKAASGEIYKFIRTEIEKKINVL